MALPALKTIRNAVLGRLGCGCETCPLAPVLTRRKVILVGSPNVGKSVVFNELTGRYVVVSNYPGTTVEVARGTTRIGDALVEVVDSPGTYSLSPSSEDEQVTQDLLLEEPADVVVHVVDARNLARMLPLTLQLLEAGLPLALDVNIIDEAERAGMSVDTGRLAAELGLPVVATAATKGLGLDSLRVIVSGKHSLPPARMIPYPSFLEAAIAEMEQHLTDNFPLAPRALALLLLQRDPGAQRLVTKHLPEAALVLDAIITRAEARRAQPLSYPIALARQAEADRIAARALLSGPHHQRRDLRELLGRLMMHPVWGIPILLAVLYFGLYLGVGKLAAGVAVDFLDNRVFGHWINPALERLFTKLVPWPVLAQLFVGEYGLFTLGVRYAFAIVLPLVGAFFLMFAVLEDSGYLPRLAMMADRVCKRIGLSGRAVIPLVLGLGCDTMATLVTRVLETRRERVIATFLLALAIPCSAQLGVILGLLAGHPAALAVWAGVVLAVFLLSGYLAAKILPGEAARFYLEIPPMRWPSGKNVLLKTYSRLKWYALEVIPVFLLASVIIWLGQLTHLFQLALTAFRPAVHALGLPNSAADAFLFGFFRRDYGAARIFDVHSSGAIAGVPLVVAMVTITLFIPCIAQFLVMVRERGIKAALAVAAFILPFAFAIGYVLNAILTALGVTL